MKVKRGDVFFADLNPTVGSEQGGIRPVVIIQNNAGNKHSSTVIAAITSCKNKSVIPTHVVTHTDSGPLKKDSVIMLEQIRTIDKKRLRNYMGTLDNSVMERVDRAYLVSGGIKNDNMKGIINE